MASRTQGDPKLFILPSGVEIIYEGGQPIMDSGLENYILILLFTGPGYPMNKIKQPSKQIGSDYLAECRKPITIDQIRKIEIAATTALKPVQDNKVGIITDLSVKMKTGNQIFLSFKINPPGKTAEIIQLSGYGNNWIMQKEAA